MAHGGALGCDVATHGCHERSDGGAYVGAEHQCAGEIKVYPSLAAHYEGDGESGCT